MGTAMDVKTIIDLVNQLHGKSFFDLWQALIKHSLKELPPNRWTVEIDKKKLGHVVTSHHIGFDAVQGAWATWSWTEEGKARVLHLSGINPDKLLLTIDGEDVDALPPHVTTGSEGQIPHVFLIVHVRFKNAAGEHDYRFAGRMQ